jgi:D-alanyl-D-alanine dipeptidase
MNFRPSRIPVLFALSLAAAPACAALPSQNVIADVDSARELLVDLQQIDPTIAVELRYATPQNFTGEILYDANRAYLRRDVAARLLRVQRALAERGWRLKVLDAYRPLSVQYRMWEVVPDPKFVSDPRRGSRHNRGAAVDITVVDAWGRELEMPTPYDDFTGRASPGAQSTPAAEFHVARLADIMVQEGFRPLDSEWWHFDAIGLDDAPLIDVPLSRLAGIRR